MTAGATRAGLRAWLWALLVAALVFASGASAAPRDGLRGIASGPGSVKPGAGLVQNSSGNAPAADPLVIGQRKNPLIEVDPNLERQLLNGGRQDFAIEFKERPNLSAARGMDWRARGRFVHRELSRAAERSQAKVKELLTRRGERFESFVVKNVILVRGGTQQTMRSLLTFPEIERLRIPPRMGLILPEGFAAPDRNTRGTANTKTTGTNIAWVEADDVWAAGNTGQGSVVGIIDSGVRFDHEALVTQYRGNNGGGSFNHNFNWLDPEGGSPFPAPASSAIADQHGTHVTGTILGDDFDPTEANRDRVGMAPGAEWIACQGFPASGSVDAALLGCGDFMLAPTDLAGNNANPDLRPMAVNNSWGACTAGVVDDFYTDVVDAWLAAGIIPVFAAGNASNCGYPSPPGLATVGSPGAYPTVFTIGSTGNANGLYAPHSNWGPTEGINIGLPNFPDVAGFPRLKPNVVAPGVNVRSTIGTGTNTYDSAGWTGTSMSTPHVTGLMALMFAAGDCLIGDFGATGTIIQQTARPINFASGTSGGAEPPGPNNLPNYATGWGEIDAPDAVQAAEEACGPQGFIAGTVTADGTGMPIADALVEIFIDENVRIFTTTTNASGQYTRRVPITMGADTYTVRVSVYGFVGESAPGLTVALEATTTQNFSLEAADLYTLSGVVSDDATGWPLHARIDIAGFPNSPVWSDPVSGSYSVDLAEGIEYTVTVTASVAGYLNTSTDVGPLNANTVQNFFLDPDLLACSAPGYSLTPVVTQNFEGGADAVTPPAGWSRSHLGTGTTPGWRFGTALGSSSFSIPAHTRYAAANDDDNDTNSTQDYLDSPVFSLMGASTPVVRFDSRLSGQWGSTGRVLGSTDGGATWPHVIGNATANGSGGAWITTTFSLTALAGSANARLRFHHNDNGDWADGWAIDDVLVTPGCVIPATGGLITGRVVDDNTGAGLSGALVSVDGGAPTTSFTVADPSIGDGFYAAYGAPGARTVVGSPGPTLPAGYGSDTDMVTVVDNQNTAHDPALTAPQLVVAPAGGPSASLELGQVQTQPFSITNQGSGSAPYQIVSAGIDEDYENGVPPSGWTVIDNGSGCPWDTNVAFGLPNYAGGQGLAATVNSDACGPGTEADTSLISPPFSLAFSTEASLDFVMAYRHLTATIFTVDITTDNGASWTTLYQPTASLDATGPGEPISIDLTDYLGAQEARLRFRYQSAWDWWVLIDQVRLFADANSVVWLGLAPTSGTAGPGASVNHNAVFRANQVPQPGNYVARMRIVESTPYPPPPLDATMDVTAPPSFGTLTGTVTGLGYCDQDPAPIEGATVFIQGSSQVYQTTTDEDGEYSWQLDAGQSPLTVSASAEGHVQASVNGIGLSPSSTATADIELRADLPCVESAPATLSATVQVDDTGDDEYTLGNAGAGELEWMISVGGDPTVLNTALLTQSLAQNVLAGNAVACGGGGTTADNSFLRVYTPAAEGFAGQVSINEVRFKVEEATAAAGGTQDVGVYLYAMTGPIEDLNLVPLGNVDVAIADGSGSSHTAVFDPPIVVDASTQILVELFSDDAGNALYPGTNDAGETAPAYVFSQACGITTPTSFDDLGFPDVDLILDIEVEGAQVCGAAATPVDWLSANPDNGQVNPGDDADEITAEFDATGKAVGTYQGALCVETSDDNNGQFFVPATMEVVAAVPDADLSISAVESADPVQAGTSLDYTVTVANAGPDAASGIEVGVDLPAALAYDTATGTNWSCTEVSGDLECQYMGSVASSASAPVLTIETTPMLAGSAVTAFSVGAATEDANPANDSVSVTTTVTPAPNVDLALNASIDPANVQAGQSVRMRLIAANVGSDAATGVEVAVTLPAGMTYVSATGTGWSCVEASGEVVCSYGASLSSGFAPTLDLTLGTGASVGPVTVEATIASNESDANAANNEGSADVMITPAGEEVFANGFESP